MTDKIWAEVDDYLLGHFSTLTGTLMAIESMLKQEIDPELEVIAV